MHWLNVLNNSRKIKSVNKIWFWNIKSRLRNITKNTGSTAPASKALSSAAVDLWISRVRALNEYFSTAGKREALDDAWHQQPPWGELWKRLSSLEEEANNWCGITSNNAIKRLSTWQGISRKKVQPILIWVRHEGAAGPGWERFLRCIKLLWSSLWFPLGFKLCITSSLLKQGQRKENTQQIFYLLAFDVHFIYTDSNGTNRWRGAELKDTVLSQISQSLLCQTDWTHTNYSILLTLTANNSHTSSQIWLPEPVKALHTHLSTHFSDKECWWICEYSQCMRSGQCNERL